MLPKFCVSSQLKFATRTKNNCKFCIEKLTLCFVVVLCGLALINGEENGNKAAEQKVLPKRSLNAFLGDVSFDSPWAVTGARFSNNFGGWNPWNSRPATPSPNDVANAIAAAKQASANVLIAQQQMQAAKENVLNQHLKINCSFT